jgi:hypothetical protein
MLLDHLRRRNAASVPDDLAAGHEKQPMERLFQAL